MPSLRHISLVRGYWQSMKDPTIHRGSDVNDMMRREADRGGCPEDGGREEGRSKGSLLESNWVGRNKGYRSLSDPIRRRKNRTSRAM
jgi:hypothetical protein